MDLLDVDRHNALRHAKSIVNAATAAGRDLTPSEQASVDADVERVNEIDRKRKTGNDFIRQLGTYTGVRPDEDDEGRSGIFSEDAKAGIVHAVKSKTLYRTNVDVKAALTSGAMLPPSGQGVQGGLYPNLLPISQLFANQAADGPVVRYYRMGAGTAAVVPEGGLKPDAGVTITPIDVVIEKIATTARFSDEMTDDATYLLTYLQQELQNAVITRENQEVLAAFAATSGVLTGAGATADVVDLIADAIAAQEAINGTGPTAVIANPTVVSAIRKSKASGDGGYRLDPLTAGPATIHGVQVVSTPVTAPGTAWVVSGTGVVIYRRGQLTAEVGYNADDWNTNQRTLRVEERMAAAVVRPSALTRLTLT